MQQVITTHSLDQQSTAPPCNVQSLCKQAITLVITFTSIHLESSVTADSGAVLACQKPVSGRG